MLASKQCKEAGFKRGTPEYDSCKARVKAGGSATLPGTHDTTEYQSTWTPLQIGAVVGGAFLSIVIIGIVASSVKKRKRK